MILVCFAPKLWVKRVFPYSVVYGVDHPSSDSESPIAVVSAAVCLISHSVIDDLRKFLDCQGSDLYKDFNLTSVKPTSKVTRGLTVQDLSGEISEYMSDKHPDVTIIQFSGNNVDLQCPVGLVVDEYLLLARQYVKYCVTTSVIICEALPWAHPKYCSTQDYSKRRQLFNKTMLAKLIHRDYLIAT